MLAHALLPELTRRGHEVVGLTRDELDVTDASAAQRRLASLRPDAVVQCAAYTAVDQAEIEIDAAFEVNAAGSERVAAACAAIGALYVYPSTDYVFGGDSLRPYQPGDPISPINAYGRSKAEGERAAMLAGRTLIVRTSWLYGEGGRHFVDSITRLARDRESLQVVDDQIGRPTWTGSLARGLAALIEREIQGIHHLTNSGEPISWFEFAREILSLQDIRTPLRPITSEEFVRPAPRPAYSVLDCHTTEAALGQPLEHWRAALGRYLVGRGALHPA